MPYPWKRFSGWLTAGFMKPRRLGKIERLGSCPPTTEQKYCSRRQAIESLLIVWRLFASQGRVPSTDRGWKGENHAPTSQESEFERLCGTLGEIGETGMPVEAHLVRGEAAAPSPAAIRGPLPRGAQSPGQAEPAAVPLAESRGERGERNCALQGTTGWSAEVL